MYRSITHDNADNAVPVAVCALKCALKCARAFERERLRDRTSVDCVA